MTLSRVAMVGAVVTGALAGAPLAVAQPVSVPPVSPVAVPALPELPVQIPALQLPTVPTPEAAPAAVGPEVPAAAGATPATVADVPACAPWTVSTVASGFGVLENLAFDGDGRLLLSESPLFEDGAIRTLTPSGEKGTLVPEVASPGGIVVDGDRVLFTTGDNAMAGLYNGTNGTVESVNFDGDDRATLARGLTMPNGLARLADGDLLVTQSLGDEPGLTRIPAGRADEPEKVRSDIGSANGLFVSGSKVYVGNTFDEDTEVRILDAADLGGDPTIFTLPGNGPTNVGDDLVVDADGLVYMALNGGGKVVRVDPATGDTCEIGTGLPLTSSVRFGAGEGWDAESLYATSFVGTVHRLTPPAN